ncbi:MULTISPECIES: pentapeptide repeat-containing protein [unclassified Tenacibaculum]|uniref:pentapeptide repeat-containing protein n=1 Tax=unclassified Tenacibaculum TaxID=2635139 RepID=UPI001F2A8893|nr:MULTISPECIES: pentapeptide repeat-containing protein [unclassified Tenacibaculum]MCF2874965.1 pentapeptide repeat-containing protein [Tenacibaculum sp. Cn5-1]MCF2935041.1 pentapeptide repeat-containing protein [Tenacibaculum sp. Cn5-34]MCG7511517.1 pentapeptide repeat-containing protein [Tenacibaculum sp. Cn5-46]
MKNIITLVAFLFCLTSFAQTKVNASDIIRDVKNGKAVNISNATITGILDFTFMNEALPKLPKRKRWWNNGGSNTIEKQITNKISFVNCTFTDDVLAYIPHEKSGYTFIANFEDVVTFRDCVFEQKAMFKYSDFESNTDFSNTKFNNDSTFKYAKFDRDITFENTFFDEPATFKYAEFKQYVSFANSTFNESATFKYSEFNDGVSFRNVKFQEDLNIKYTKVHGQFDITNMEVAYEIDSKYTKINGRSFSKHLLKSKN